MLWSMTYRRFGVCALLAVLLGCGSADGDDDGATDGPPSPLPSLPGCRAHLTGLLKQQPFNVPAPTVMREGGTSLTGAWTDPAVTKAFVAPDWVDVPCGAPTASISFSEVRGVGRLASRIRVDVPANGGSPADLVFLTPEPAVADDPTLGPTVPLVALGAFPVELVPTDVVADICQTSQTRFPLPDIVLTAKAEAPPTGYEVLASSGTRYSWSPLLDWKSPDAPYELADAAVLLVCDSAWSFNGGYQLIYESELDGIVKARAQHDFWFEGELALLEDSKVLGYYRLYDIAVETSGNVTGSYSGPSDVLIAVEGFYEKDVDGKAYVDLPYFEATGISWQFTLDVVGTKISENNPDILQDHLDRLNLTFPPSPDRMGYLRLPAEGLEDTQSFDRPEGFVIANWGFQRRLPGEP